MPDGPSLYYIDDLHQARHQRGQASPVASTDPERVGCVCRCRCGPHRRAAKPCAEGATTVLTIGTRDAPMCPPCGRWWLAQHRDKVIGATGLDQQGR